jgi:hypothetical protein
MATRKDPKSSYTGSITVRVVDSGGMRGVLSNASVNLYLLDSAEAAAVKGNDWQPGGKLPFRSGQTHSDGKVTFSHLPPSDHYVVRYEHYVPAANGAMKKGYAYGPVSVTDTNMLVPLELPLKVRPDEIFSPADSSGFVLPRVGGFIKVTVHFHHNEDLLPYVTLVLPPGASPFDDDPYAFTFRFRGAGHLELKYSLQYARLTSADAHAMARSGGADSDAMYALSTKADVEALEPLPIAGNVSVSMTRTETEPTADLRLFAAIRASTDALSFVNYLRFMDQLFCKHDNSVTPHTEKDTYNALLRKRFLPFTDTDAYRVMKAATEAFVIVNCGVFTGDGDLSRDPVLAGLAGYLDRRDLPLPGPELYLEDVNGVKMLPYLAIIRRKLPDVAINQPAPHHQHGVDLCDGFVQEKLSNPCLLELIWSYWHEEGMLVQTMNAITRRFQNVRGPANPDPLANLEVNPLRPLNNMIWGYIQDEQHRLTVARRNYEYDHHYGLRLEGRAVQNFRPADSRSKFIEGFHHLLRLCTVFYRQDDDTTVKADAFGVLNALKELHLTISQGAHSQFGDLPPTARIEMLMQQWLLARPEFRDFLPTRAMVAYPEPWMDRVDAMKTLQGWTDTSVVHFHNLGVFGEQLVLSIRYGNWSAAFEPTSAFNWARFWRPQVQGYIHAYRAATGLDLSIDARNPAAEATLPSVLLRQRLAQQARTA